MARRQGKRTQQCSQNTPNGREGALITKFRKIAIRNYRSLESVVVDLESFTALIGANNAGKTSVLSAIDLFSGSERTIAADDFNDRQKDVEMILTMECQREENAVPERFCINGEFAIKKTYSLNDDGVTLSHSAKVLLNSKFKALRNCRLSSEIKSEIKKLRSQYSDLPSYGKGTNKGKWLEKFEKYDQDFYITHADDPGIQDHYITWDTRAAPLEQLLEIIHVPSMRDITTDGVDGSGSYLTQLISMAIEDAHSNDPTLAAAVDTSASDYETYVRVLRKNVINSLNTSLAKNSGRYVGDSSIRIEIASPKQILPRPIPSIVISEGTRKINLEHAGGGTRRVYLMSLLETISERQGQMLGRKHGTRAKLIMIDEPELYQHPQRQRQMLLTMTALTNAAEGAVQVICSTHSPYFIELRQIAGLRLIQKGNPTRVLRTAPASLMRHILGPEKAKSPGGPDKLRTWLDMNSTHWVTEGFFSTMAVIMEGPGDRNMLLATADAMGVNLDRHEMSLVPANGKPKILGLAHIFAPFKVPVYVIWDLDYRRGHPIAPLQRSLNARIIKLASGDDSAKYENLEETEINGKFSCFKDNLTASLAEDLEGCEDALSGMAEYKELQRAKQLDADAPGGRALSHHQKHVLNSRETVFGMLAAIREKEPRKLDSFVTVRVVRQLEEIGRGLERRPPGGAPSP